jgi:uncharacterized protein (TIGR03435 family)
MAMTYTAFSTLALTSSPEPLALDGPDWRSRLHSIGPILLTATTLKDSCQWLEGLLGHPVIDETNLPGTYDIEVQGDMQGFDELREALFTQLALVLTRTQRDLPLLVVRRPH